MSLRAALVVAALLVGCGSNKRRVEKGEPQTAREKQMLEAKKSGDIDKPSPKWGKWRYRGDRNNCFYVVGARCFKTKNSACQAARCKAPKSCNYEGAGPATVSCK